MRIAVFGTGMVGRALAGRLNELGHEVSMGTRDPAASRDRSDDPLPAWLEAHPDVALAAFAEAADGTDLIVNATSGLASEAALGAAGDALDGTVVLDVANALDFSHGMPPRVAIGDSGSLAETLQAAFPSARIVKGLNTMSATVMVDPSRVPGEHAVFLAGDDDHAKDMVRILLHEIGWPDSAILDLGGLSAARGLELMLPVWLTLWGTLGTADFNFAVHRAG